MNYTARKCSYHTRKHSSTKGLFAERSDVGRQGKGAGARVRKPVIVLGWTGEEDSRWTRVSLSERAREEKRSVVGNWSFVIISAQGEAPRMTTVMASVVFAGS